MYSPTLGRFLQTDPIGYGDGLNWYNYVGGDPVNATDPSGLEEKDDILDILVDGKRIKKQEAIKEPLDFGPSFGALYFLNRSGPDTSNGLFGDGSGALGLVEIEQNDQQPVCPAPSNVSLSGQVFTGPAGLAFFNGTLKDVSTGRTYSTSGFGYGGGLIAGVYDVQGTVKGFDALSNGLDIAFVQAPYGSGGASFSDNNGRSIGEGSVSGAIAPPIGAGGVSFDPLRLTQTNSGKCK
jgi:hypothetical protein